ncbi:MAG: Na(+)-translocating NADH-quinone reductase subunit A [Flavobacteriaceae bacterium]|nr:Na(+)-translocating NADH-quinone reductase subunit A [Flavobacteriaceae bacterium]
MSKDIRIPRGTKLSLDGEANKILVELPRPKTFVLKPDDFFNITPKLIVKEGESVKKGSPLFFSKQNPRIHFVSPVSGEVSAIVRGAKRKILQVLITSDESDEAISYDVPDFESLDAETIKEIILKSGSWPFIKQRPYNIIAQPEDTPKSIFISTYSTAPLDVDYEFLLKNNKQDFQKGISVLKKLTSGNVNLTFDESFNGFFGGVKNAELIGVSGKHPAGNVGVQIHHVDPINYGERVWVIEPEDVVNIGILFSTGEFSSQRTIAVVGSSVAKPQYFKTTIGAALKPYLEASGITSEEEVRVINGDVLSGTTSSEDGYIGYYNNIVSVIPEGNLYRMFGWLPFVDNHIPSISKTSLSWLFGSKKSKVTTNLNGEERALVVTGEMEKVFPMNIFPMQLIKACIAEDIEKMEALGIYEVVPEDFGLIDYASTSKIEAQDIIKKGIALMIKEVG